MTEAESITAATRVANELNWPWDVSAVTAKRWRLWPFPPCWRVISRVVNPAGVVGGLAISTLRVYERRHGEVVVPVRVVYPAGGLRGEGSASLGP